MEKKTNKVNEDATCWYAVYAAARAEMSVRKKLERMGLKCYLPLQSVIRVWNNQERKIEIPVISGLVFVRLSETDVIEVVSAIKDASLLQKVEGCCVSVTADQLELFRESVENAGSFINFALDDSEQENKDTLIRIEGLGVALFKG